MSLTSESDMRNFLLSKTQALGNSHRGLKEVCSDLLNAYGKGDLKTVERGTFLSRTTLLRMMELTETEHGEPYRPNADTCERILKYFNAQIEFKEVRISRRFRPQPKRHDDDY